MMNVSKGIDAFLYKQLSWHMHNPLNLVQLYVNTHFNLFDYM